MPDLIFRDTDPDEFRRQIVAELAAEILEILAGQDGPRLVDRQKMAELAGIGTATLDGLVASGAIPSVKIGRRRLFEPKKVIDAMAKGGP